MSFISCWSLTVRIGNPGAILWRHMKIMKYYFWYPVSSDSDAEGELAKVLIWWKLCADMWQILTKAWCIDPFQASPRNSGMAKGACTSWGGRCRYQLSRLKVGDSMFALRNWHSQGFVFNITNFNLRKPSSGTDHGCIAVSMSWCHQILAVKDLARERRCWVPQVVAGW